MSNLFSIFARLNSIDPLYSTLDTARQPSNLTSVEVLSLSSAEASLTVENPNGGKKAWKG